ncbi:MAG TPA: OmpA family protein [Acidobacteriota bacterium]|nr:OmpA family protein [Acidobacteriota bacterium]
MKRETLLLMSTILLVAGFNSLALAQEQTELEHPVIKPLPGATLKEKFSKKENFSAKTFRIKEDNKTQNVEKKGQYWRLRYEFIGADGQVDRSKSRVEVIENYIAAVLERGGKVENKGSNYLVFSVPRKDGGLSWAYVNATSGSYLIEIIDEKPLERVLTFGADELKLALDAEGRVAVYGINFEIDKADLQLGAEEVISEIVKLMQMYPELKIEIQGHTDNTGTAQHNLELSNRRADTVMKFMTLYGIEASRLVAKGYGQAQPLASNDTEEGRAQNRRVELVKIQ